ncbi:c-type cytochrome [Yoonia sp.]|uniref:c-type cytochrome n=1 Tax=Yoonia sp. TaxID=2212373 RepID=UPI00358FF9ED
MARWPLILGAMVAAIGSGWYVTRPAPLADNALDGLTPDAARGAVTFAAAGCASCHTSEAGPDTLLTGGKRFASPFGTFVAPNISSDQVHGVGGWSDLELASAIVAGVSQDGSHLYPAFPYTSYNKADMQDVVDLIAHMRTLPASDAPSPPHEIGFPFNLRAALGPWKALFVSEQWVLTTAETDVLERGRYLVEALGHCAECHTPRGALGGLQRDQWMAGAPNPSGEGRIPNITPAALQWSERDIAEYLKSGFTPDFDSAGGEMVAVIKNTSQLTDADRAAIAAYLKAIPAIANP